MNWSACDDDGYWPDDELPGWEEIEECAGPEYLAWKWVAHVEAVEQLRKDLRAAGMNVLPAPEPSVYVHSKDWMDNLC